METPKLSLTAIIAANSSLSQSSCRLFIFDPMTKLRFLVDSGSDVSALPSSKFKHLSKKPDQSLNAANGSGIDVYGTKFLKMSLGFRRQFSGQFLVASVTKPIIGADFLKETGLLIDLKNNRLIDPSNNTFVKGSPCHLNFESLKFFEVTKEYDDLLKRFPELMNPPDFNIPVKHSVVHFIHTKGQIPHARTRRLNPMKLKAAKQEFDYMTEIGICRPSTSPFSSALHMAPKPEPNDWRPCGDYRALNSVTIPDRYPLPHIHDFANQLFGCSIFSKIDLVRAFHHIPVAPDDVHKTAVITPFGLYEFLRMPFGLRNAGQTFQRFMHQVTKGLDFVFVYIDDVLIFSHSLDEHLNHLSILFERLREFGLRIKPSKCVFGVEELDFLSYKISRDGISPSHKRVEAINDFPEPRSLKQLQRFIGMVNYYHRFIPNLARSLSPLYEYLTCLQKDKKVSKTFKLSDSCLESIREVKQSLMNVTLLSFPKPSASLCIATDASQTDVGAVLQQFEENCWKPLAFFSKKLNSAQQKYSTFDRELTAAYLAVKHFQHFVEDQEFHILTDHKPLVTALTCKTNKSPRQERHLEFIAQFTNDIRYVKGSDNVVADALSRPDADSIDFIKNNLLKLSKEQALDSELNEFRQNPPENTKVKLECVTIPASNLTLWCETSTKIDRPFIPFSLRRTVYDSIHLVSHPGVKTTRKKVSRLYFWPGMNKDIHEWASSCEQCQKQKVSRHVKTPIQGISIPEAKFRHIHVDIVGPLPPSDGYRYILTIVDRFTRWPEAYPITNIEAKTVAKVIVSQYISRFGIPERMTTDQGSQFESKLMNEMCKMLGIRHIHTTPYHPASNGMVERFHRQLKASIRASQNVVRWSEALPLILLGIRSSVKDDLGFSPSLLLYGQEIRLPDEIFTPFNENDFPDPDDFVQNLRRMFDSVKTVDTRVPKNQNVYVPDVLNDCKKVLIRIDRVKKPFEDTYEGPFDVVRRLRKVVIIKKNGKDLTVSLDRVKPFKSFVN